MAGLLATAFTNLRVVVTFEGMVVVSNRSSEIKSSKSSLPGSRPAAPVFFCILVDDRGWLLVVLLIGPVFTSRSATFNSPVAAALTPGIEFAASTTFFAILVVSIDFSVDLAELASGVLILASTLTRLA